MSVKVSAAMKIAKTIQYIIHRTCGTQSTEVGLEACGANTAPGWPSPKIPESLSRCIAAFPHAWLDRSLCEAAAHSCAHPVHLHRRPMACTPPTPTSTGPTPSFTTPLRMCHSSVPLEKGQASSDPPHLNKSPARAVILPHHSQALLPPLMLTYSRMFLVFTAL